MSYYILADNQDVTRYAVETLLRQEEEEHSILYAADRATLVDLLQAHEQAVVVLDYTLFDFLDEGQLMIISERFSSTRWMLFSDELSEPFLRRVICTSGVFSVVFKDSSLLTICEALRMAAQGKHYVCQRAMETVLAHPSDTDESHLLTSTERAIAVAIALGKTTKEIAAERVSSVHTINTHRKNIFRKLKVNTAHEVIKYALRAGWVDSAEFQI